jgi:hypothetical protein
MRVPQRPVPNGHTVRHIHNQLRGPRRGATAGGFSPAGLMARGLRVRRRGSWKTAVMQHPSRRSAPAHPTVTSFMEDYTYHLGPGIPKIPRRAHARGLLDHRRRSRGSRSTRSASATRRTPLRLVFEPGAATILGICDLADRSRLVRNGVDVVAPDELLPSFRSPGRSRSPSRTWRRRWSRGSQPGVRTAPHGAVDSGGH